MGNGDALWLASSGVLAVIAWLRFRAGLQRIGSLIVASTMAAAAVAIICSAEKTAQALQVGGIVISGLMIALNERWKRPRK